MGTYCPVKDSYGSMEDVHGLALQEHKLLWQATQAVQGTICTSFRLLTTVAHLWNL